MRVAGELHTMPVGLSVSVGASQSPEGMSLLVIVMTVTSWAVS
jgi:hypothetical protein